MHASLATALAVARRQKMHFPTPKAGKETLALMLAKFFRLPAAANRLKVDKNSATRHVVLIFENAAFGCFWNKATKIKTKTSLYRDSFS